MRGPSLAHGPKSISEYWGPQIYTLVTGPMKDLTGAKLLKSERILFNAVEALFDKSDDVRKIR
jgi:hypothetical protein